VVDVAVHRAAERLREALGEKEDSGSP